MSHTFEAITPRTQEGMSFYLHALGSGWYFRVGPVRDPMQPRLWRLLLDPCTAPNDTDTRGHYEPRLAVLVMERGDVSARLQKVQERPMAWLGEHDNRALLRWMEQISSLAPPPSPSVRSARTKLP